MPLPVVLSRVDCLRTFRVGFSLLGCSVASLYEVVRLLLFLLADCVISRMLSCIFHANPELGSNRVQVVQSAAFDVRVLEVLLLALRPRIYDPYSGWWSLVPFLPSRLEGRKKTLQSD